MEIGELLVGKYRVERVLGRGGQGEVVQATNLMLGQPVAMKFLLPAMASDQVIVQRFLREARAAVQLKSEHVARVLDVGTLETAAPYIVFEYLDGADLNSWPRDGLTLGTITDLVLQATEALAEAHSKGIVHRDIKPANLFITMLPDGSPCLKVLDFGISKVADAVGVSGLTASNTMMGTPSYASPEQLMSTRDIDHRTDIWSLGIVLYELVEGRVPYHGDTLTQLVMKVMTEPPPPLSASVPPAVAAVIERCLHKDPALRFQSMGELARALAPFASSIEHAAMLARRASRISSPVIDVAGNTPPAQPSVVPVRSRRRWPVPVLIGATVGAALVALLIFRGHTNHSNAQLEPAALDAQVQVVETVAVVDAGDDRGDRAKKGIVDALAAVVAWTKAHPADPCPSIDGLGTDVVMEDPWQSRLVVTCIDQPGDQIAGVVSAGPDRKLGTVDDVKSWSLAPEVVAMAAGPRFTPKIESLPISRPTVTRKPPVKPKGKVKGTRQNAAPGRAIVDRDGDGIPDVR